VNLGPDVAAQASSFLYRFHSPDTSEWVG